MYKILKFLTFRHFQRIDIKIKYLPFIVVIAITFNMLLPYSSVLANTTEVKNILIITSYEQNEYWESNVLKGIYDNLKFENIKPIYKVEYLSITGKDENYFDTQAQLLSLKYKDTKFDLVIVIDDEALNFFSSYGKDIFGQIPTVYGGINNHKNLYQYPYNTYAGVVEHYNVNSLTDLILNAHPNIQQVNVILNNSTFSSVMEEEIKSSLAYWSTNIKFNFIREEYIEDISAKLENLPSPRVYLLVGNFKTKDNFLVPYSEAISKIKACGDCSIYSLNGGYIDDCSVIGGYVLSGIDHGKLIAQISVRVLNGESPKSINTIHDNNGVFTFNYHELIKNKIPEDSLPKNTLIKNRPTLSGSRLYLTVISVSLLIILCISIIIYQFKERLKNITRIKYEKKRYEDVLEYDKMKTEFLANISHELRTPLNVMLSGLQLLEMHKNKGDLVFKNEELIEKAYYVKQNGYRLLRLINNLIDVTKIDSGFFHLQLETKNIVEVIEDITLSIGEYMKQKGINLIFDTNEEELYISIDTDKIERIMLNLLSNAIKFTPENGTILVTVNCSDDLVKVSVKDDGIGIPRAMQKEIFNRFTQVDSSLHRNKQGSGIGLSLVKSLVELHKGKIYVESLEGKGSTFTFELPVAKGKENPEAAVTSLDGDKSAYNEKIVLEFSDIHESNTF